MRAPWRSTRKNRISATDYISMYQEMRGYFQRELDLIHNRLTWILTIHGFLYATYGGVLITQAANLNRIIADHTLIAANGNALFAAIHSPLVVQLELYLFTVSLVGAAISRAGLRSIEAAVAAMNALTEIFNHKNESIHKYEKVYIAIRNPDEKVASYSEVAIYRTAFGMFPAIKGGGFTINDLIGNSQATIIPKILLVSWAVSLIVDAGSILWLYFIN